MTGAPDVRRTAQNIGHDFEAGARQTAVPISTRVRYDPDAATEKETVQFLCEELPPERRLDPSRLPGRIWQCLGQSLPKGQLKTTLLRHTDKFELHDAADGTWGFSVRRPRAGVVAAPRPGGMSDTAARAGVLAAPAANSVLSDATTAVLPAAAVGPLSPPPARHLPTPPPQ